MAAGDAVPFFIAGVFGKKRLEVIIFVYRLGEQDEVMLSRHVLYGCGFPMSFTERTLVYSLLKINHRKHKVHRGPYQPFASLCISCCRCSIFSLSVLLSLAG